MGDTTDIKSTLMYGTNNKIRPYFYAYERSEEERKSSHNESDLGGEIVGTEVTGLWKKLLFLFFLCVKGGFFSESAMRFLDLQISKKKFQKAILSLKFQFPAKNSKQQIQISSSG